MTELIERAYRSGERRRWICVREAAAIVGSYTKDATSDLARKLGLRGPDMIEGWACAGWLRKALWGMRDHNGVDLYCLRNHLSIAHFVVAGRAFHNQELDPASVFDWLVLCYEESKSADWLREQLDSTPPEQQWRKKTQRLVNNGWDWYYMSESNGVSEKARRRVKLAVKTLEDE